MPGVNANVRNVGILLLAALAIVVLPGAGAVAALLAAVLSVVFAGAVGYFGGRTYLERRIEIYGLEETHRAILYGAIGVLVVTVAAASRLTSTGPGALAMIVLLGLSGYGFFFVFQAWRR